MQILQAYKQLSMRKNTIISKTYILHYMSFLSQDCSYKKYEEKRKVLCQLSFYPMFSITYESAKMGEVIPE